MTLLPPAPHSHLSSAMSATKEVGNVRPQKHPITEVTGGDGRLSGIPLALGRAQCAVLKLNAPHPGNSIRHIPRRSHGMRGW